MYEDDGCSERGYAAFLQENFDNPRIQRVRRKCMISDSYYMLRNNQGLLSESDIDQSQLKVMKRTKRGYVEELASTLDVFPG